MAQIGIKALLATAALTYQAMGLAQTDLRQQALAAEGAGRWQDALSLYQQLLSKNPEQADLWVRVSDINAKLDYEGLSLWASVQAAKNNPQDPNLHFRLSQAFGMNNRPLDAIDSIGKALAIDPNNVSYLHHQAQLASWVGNAQLAHQTYKQLLAINQRDKIALHGMARIQSRVGNLDRAAQTYQTYRTAYPQDSSILLDYADTEIYRGDYSHAYQLQQIYFDKNGSDLAFRKARANLYARSGRPRLALEILSPLLRDAPDDYDLNLIRTLALNEYRQRKTALQSVATLQQLGATRPETEGARLQVETPLSGFIGGGVAYQSDSDEINILHTRLFGQYSVNPDLLISGGVARRQLDAQKGTGLEPIKGGKSINLDEAWVSGRYQVHPYFSAGLGIGIADGRGQNTTTYDFDLDYWLHDELILGYRSHKDVVAVSPRAVEVFVPRNNHRITASWSPSYNSHVDTELLYSDYDDGNDLTQLTVSPRWAYLRTGKHNLDIGLTAQWFSFSKNLNNGYYDPEDYRRLWAVAYYYRKLSDNDGLGIVVGLGPERDVELEKNYELGGNLRIEGTFGIYRDWQLKTWAGIGGRFSDSDTGAGSASGRLKPYRSYGLGLELIRRF